MFTCKENNEHRIVSEGKTIYNLKCAVNGLADLGADVYVATNCGLFQLKRNKDSIAAKVFYEDTNIEKIFKDKNGNLWLGTSNKGLFLIHKNVLQNEAYQLKAEGDEKEDNSFWSFFSYQGSQYACTSKGIKFPVKTFLP